MGRRATKAEVRAREENMINLDVVVTFICEIKRELERELFWLNERSS